MLDIMCMYALILFIVKHFEFMYIRRKMSRFRKGHSLQLVLVFKYFWLHKHSLLSKYTRT